MKIKLNKKMVFLLLIVALVSVAANVEVEHCVIAIDPIQNNELFSETLKPVCFKTFSDAIFFATGGTAALEKSISPNMLTDELLNGTVTQASYVIGIDYDYPSFGGSSITWTTSNVNGCMYGQSYTASSMPAGWDNRVSSAISFMGCNHYYHYDYSNYGGASYDCGGSCSSMETMSNKTSSERWTP